MGRPPSTSCPPFSPPRLSLILSQSLVRAVLRCIGPEKGAPVIPHLFRTVPLCPHFTELSFCSVFSGVVLGELLFPPLRIILGSQRQDELGSLSFP